MRYVTPADYKRGLDAVQTENEDRRAISGARPMATDGDVGKRGCQELVECLKLTDVRDGRPPP